MAASSTVVTPRPLPAATSLGGGSTLPLPLSGMSRLIDGSLGIVGATQRPGGQVRQRKEDMDVHLSAEVEQLLEAKVASGRYGSASDVVSMALRALEQQELALDIRADGFKSEIERRLASGPATPMDFSEIKRRIRTEVESQKKQRHS
jgi:antitoxin ParD1/3/4